MKKKVLKKAQKGTQVTSSDSTKYYKDEAKFQSDLAAIKAKYGLKKQAEESMSKSRQASKDASRQQFKGKLGFDKLGNAIKKSGGSVKAKKK